MPNFIKAYWANRLVGLGTDFHWGNILSFVSLFSCQSERGYVGKRVVVVERGEIVF